MNTLKSCNTIVIGSGAAGLACAARLKKLGVDVKLYTDDLTRGTSLNTGSDKQTYYKLGMYGSEPDSPALMAADMCASGSCHGDLAYVEAALSAEAFHNLVLMGVPFPHDEFGQHIGYKTDHDPKRRATSCGPFTSREMCNALIAEINRLEVPVCTNRLAVSLCVSEDRQRVFGAAFRNTETGELEVQPSQNVVLAVGGPGGLYEKSVYPENHIGGIGIALQSGVQACNLQESQYGLASLKPRWNVSGSYMQALPRFISTDQNGHDEREFLREYFPRVSELYDAIFLKGYQWPFAASHIPGSSLIDIFVYIETEIRNRKVYLDFRTDPKDLNLTFLSDETRQYLENSKATARTPYKRLLAINAPAAEFFAERGCDLKKVPLEVGVCAQHNNAGLETNAWWESVNMKHLFVIGEVNGSHGVTRPGGTALNAGQVGALRAAEYIAAKYPSPEQNLNVSTTCKLCDEDKPCTLDWRKERRELQERMTMAGSFLRTEETVTNAIQEAQAQYLRFVKSGLKGLNVSDMVETERTYSLCIAQLCYLAAILEQCRSAGSRGGSIVLDDNGRGRRIHNALGSDWTMVPEDESYRRGVLTLKCEVTDDDINIETQWEDARPIPSTDGWFENVWKEFREGGIYR
ncbi:MAG: FAD-binding protein [Lentisphaeria bacterium]|nr:FAD-binding protein [Lentisphaeria bacterium]